MDIRPYFKAYGREVKIVSSDGEVLNSGKCFVQAIRYKNKMYVEGTPTEIGINSAGYYLYLGPPEMRIDLMNDTDTLLAGDKSYHVDRCENIYNGEDVCFIWAVLKECEKGDYYFDNCNSSI